MSADLSDPAIAPLVSAVESSSDPTSWLLLHYSTPSQPSPLIPLASGSDPVLTQWQEHIRACGEEVIFGYGELGTPPMRKGLVLLYLSSAVGGVRRARAVVHSRAVLQLFPDYSALVTISHPDELTEELVADKLGLPSTHPSTSPLTSQSPPAAHPSAPPAEEILSARDMSATDSPKRGLYRLSEASHETDSPIMQSNGTFGAHSPDHSESTNAVPFPTSPQPDDFNPSHDRKTSLSLSARMKKAMPGLTSAFGQPQSLPPASEHAPSPPATGSPSTPPSKKMSLAGILPGRNSDSTEHKRSPKSSLTTNFGRPSQSTPPPQPTDASANLDHRALTSSLINQSPSSPRTGSIGRFFSRKSASAASPTNSQPSSPVIGRNSPREPSEFAPPPLPPKDPAPSAQPRDVFGIGEDEPRPSGGSSQLHSSHEATGRKEDRYSPSPSAKEALALAASRRVQEEHDIQEDFRRHEEQRQRLRTVSMNRNAVVLDDVDLEDVGLPYDRPSMDDTHRSGSDHHTVGTAENALQGHYPGGLVVANGTSPSSRLEDLAAAEEGHAEQVVDTERGVMPVSAIAAEEEARQVQAQKEVEALEAERKARAELAAEEAALVAKEAEEHERTKVLEAERARIEAEKEEMRRAEAERREREAREAQEAEARRLEEVRLEQERKAAEQARLEEERRRFEEAERQRIETEEREKREEEARKIETARVRKESLRDLFRKGKAEGSVMLHGHVTVQTMTNVTWRRRHFQLFGHELRLFKAENDAQPLLAIPLMRGSQISEKYEESVVQDSFKLISRDGKLGSPSEVSAPVQS